jgi:hypothetical protein
MAGAAFRSQWVPHCSFAALGGFGLGPKIGAAGFGQGLALLFLPAGNGLVVAGEENRRDFSTFPGVGFV